MDIARSSKDEDSLELGCFQPKQSCALLWIHMNSILLFLATCRVPESMNSTLQALWSILCIYQQVGWCGYVRWVRHSEYVPCSKQRVSVCVYVHLLRSFYVSMHVGWDSHAPSFLLSLVVLYVWWFVRCDEIWWYDMIEWLGHGRIMRPLAFLWNIDL